MIETEKGRRSVALGLFNSLEGADLEMAKQWICENAILRQELAYGDAKAATVGNAQEPSDAVIERIERFCTDYAQCLVDATLHDKRPFDAVDHRTCESMEAVEAKLIRELAEDIATVGAGTCKDLGGIGADDEVVFNCSECGCVLSAFDKDGKNNLCTSFIYDYPRFCPECGRKVIESKEETE